MKIGFRESLSFLSSRMANNGKFAAVDQGVISAANFAASILLAFYVSPTQLGVYVIGFLAIYFIRAIQNGIIIQPLNTYGAGKSHTDFREYFSAVAISQIILSTSTALAAAVLGWALTISGNDTLGPTISVLWCSFFTWQLQEFLRRTFYTRGEIHKAVWVSLTANIIRLSLIVILARYGRISGLKGLQAIGWGAAGATILGIWLAKDYFCLQYKNLWVTWLENWKFGRWILGASLADWVVVDLYPIIMAGMISFAATGVYQTLQNLVAPIHVLLRAIDTFVTPIFAKAYDQSGLTKVRQNLLWIYIGAGLPVIGLLVIVLFFTPQLLFLLKGDTYLPYADGIYIMALFYLLMFLNRPLQLVFRAIRQGKQIFLANIIAMVSMFSIGLWMINRWGVYGGIGGQALNAFIISLVLLAAWLRLGGRREKNVTTDVVDVEPD